MSTTDALLYCTEKIRFDLNKKNRYRIFFRPTKSFDSISHPILLYKTKLLGFSEQANTILNSYLENRVQKVKFSKYESNWIALNRGVPQGTVLGPLLFNKYVSDMKDDTDVTVRWWYFYLLQWKNNLWIKITYWKKVLLNSFSFSRKMSKI